MKITAISVQKRNQNRLNISVDGTYRFSLDAYQLVDLGIRVGREYNEPEIVALEQESQFGKLYGRTLEYCLMRPHSAKEVRDYLFRKTMSTRDKTGKIKPGYSAELTKRVFERLVEKGYIDDSKFTRYWVENRCIQKGASKRKLIAELKLKGVDATIINQIMDETERNDADEIQKIIIKKKSHYPDEQKLIAYLARQGFHYSDIKQAIEGDRSS